MAAAYLLEDNEIVGLAGLGWAGPGLTGSWAGHSGGDGVQEGRRQGSRVTVGTVSTQPHSYQHQQVNIRYVTSSHQPEQRYRCAWQIVKSLDSVKCNSAANSSC